MYNINYDKIVSIKDKLTKINIEKLLEINNNFLNIDDAVVSEDVILNFEMDIKAILNEIDYSVLPYLNDEVWLKKIWMM